MPAPLVILAIWIGQQLASNVESEFWTRVKGLILGDPQDNPLARALYQSINATVDAVAKDGSADNLREAVYNAFKEYRLHGKLSSKGTVLGDLRYSIECTLRESGLNLLVPNGSMTQLQYLAPGISMERLVAYLTQSFVINVKKLATRAGSPLHNLSDQLNADEIQESLQLLSDNTRSIMDKVDAIILASNMQLLTTASRSEQDQELARGLVAAMYKTLKLIHRDYLLTFADAEKALREGIGSTDLIYFFETRRAALAADRIEATARAKQILSSEVGGKANNFSAFAQAVSAYFNVSNGPARITYFTDLLTYIRGMLQTAKDKEWTGKVRINSYFFTTTDRGEMLLGALASARAGLQQRFEDVAHEFTLLGSSRT